MSDIVIKAENLGKKYMIGHQADRADYTNLREVMMQNAKSLWNKTKDLATGKPIIEGDTVEEVWALKDVSFEVSRGEAVGIIGRNGAGKSTLLKILSRITEPSTGRVRIKDRVASLLEVGTGFHPELSGRENIYLNGTILGMTRAEIKNKFDEIVAFAEIEKYLDTPVKRYSSGMYVRLAFAVAAHLEPEILVVDEVLAVGDAQFQKKCLGKMEAVGKEGRTVLFVSHNMGAIRQLCPRVMLLKSGCISKDGPASEIAEFYLRDSIGVDDIFCGKRIFQEDLEKDFQTTSICLMNNRGEVTVNFDCDEPVKVEINCISRRPIPGLYGYLGVLNREGQPVWVSDSMDVQPNRLDALSPGFHRINISIPSRSLASGEYVLTISFASTQANHAFHVDHPGESVAFRLEDSSSLRGTKRQGYFSTLLPWQLEPIKE